MSATPPPTRSREVEWKLRGPVLGADAALLAVQGAAGIALDDPVTHHLHARYLDTADLRLARRGITLRRRTGGTDDGWHLKLARPAHGGDRWERDEVVEPLDAGSDDSPPSGLRSLVSAFVRSAPLTPIVDVRTDRTVRAVRSADGTVIGELAHDVVDARRPTSGDTPGAHGRVAFEEWEAEARPGNEDAMEHVVATLRAHGFSPSDAPSKLRQALGGGLLPPPELHPDHRPRRRDQARDDLVYYLGEQVESLLAEDHRVRLQEFDAVHRSRVALRRIRSALRTFAPVLEPGTTTALREELAWAADALGRERDLEVIRGRLLSSFDRLDDGAGASAQARALVVDDLDALMTQAHDELVAAMDTPRWTAMLDALVAYAADPPTAPEAARPAGEVLPPLARKAWRRLQARTGDLTPSAPDEHWHRARIAAKRSRYATDAAVPAIGGPARAMSRALAEVTEVLGDLQDTSVARAYLTDLVARRTPAPEVAYVLGRIHADQERAAAALKEAFPEVLAAASRPKVRRWLNRGHRARPGGEARGGRAR